MVDPDARDGDADPADAALARHALRLRSNGISPTARNGQSDVLAVVGRSQSDGPTHGSMPNARLTSHAFEVCR